MENLKSKLFESLKENELQNMHSIVGGSPWGEKVNSTDPGILIYMKTILYIFLIILSIQSYSQTFFIIEFSKCDSLMENEKYEEAILCFLEYENDKRLTVRKIACAYGLMGNLDSALKYLNIWVDSGNVEIGFAIMPHFKSFRNNNKWHEFQKKLISKYKEKNPDFQEDYFFIIYNMFESFTNKRHELMKDIEDEDIEDDGFKEKAILIREELNNILAGNLNEIEALIDIKGWPSPDRVGSVNNMFFLRLIEDSDNLLYYKKYFSYIEEDIANGNSGVKASYAQIQDKVLVLEGKKQKYGSQLYFDENQMKFVFYPIEGIENIENINILRREAGFFECLEDFAKHMSVDLPTE